MEGRNSGNLRGTAAWIAQGIKLQEAQYVLSSRLRSYDLIKVRLRLASSARDIKPHSSNAAKLNFTQKCQRLTAQIQAHEQRANTYMVPHVNLEEPVPVNDMKVPNQNANNAQNIDDENGDASDDQDPPAGFQDEDEEIPAYKMRIALPSSLSREEIIARGIRHVLEAELDLRSGQAEDRLADLRILLAWSAALYRQGIRTANSYKSRNRAWAESRNISKAIRIQSRAYAQARGVLLKFTFELSPAGREIRAKYRELTKDDLKTSTELISYDVRGNRNEPISWIWHSAGASDSNNDEWLRECEF